MNHKTYPTYNAINAINTINTINTINANKSDSDDEKYLDEAISIFARERKKEKILRKFLMFLFCVSAICLVTTIFYTFFFSRAVRAYQSTITDVVCNQDIYGVKVYFPDSFLPNPPTANLYIIYDILRYLKFFAFD